MIVEPFKCSAHLNGSVDRSVDLRLILDIVCLEAQVVLLVLVSMHSSKRMLLPLQSQQHLSAHLWYRQHSVGNYPIHQLQLEKKSNFSISVDPGFALSGIFDVAKSLTYCR
jgi:hypothetical protein